MTAAMLTLRQRRALDEALRDGPRPFGRFTGNVQTDEPQGIDRGLWRALLLCAVAGGALLAVFMWGVWRYFA